MSGWGYTFAQLLIPLGIVAALGVLTGMLAARRWWPSTEVVEVPGERVEVPVPVPAGDPEADPEELARLRAELDGAERDRTDLRARIADIEARASELNSALMKAGDDRDIEIGRIEAAALRALDETIGQSESRQRRLEEEVARLRADRAELMAQSDLLVRRAEHLEKVLAERDARLARLHQRLDGGAGL